MCTNRPEDRELQSTTKVIGKSRIRNSDLFRVNAGLRLTSELPSKASIFGNVKISFLLVVIFPCRNSKQYVLRRHQLITKAVEILLVGLIFK